jgi:hypothetical protein
MFTTQQASLIFLKHASQRYGTKIGYVLHSEIFPVMNSVCLTYVMTTFRSVQFILFYRAIRHEDRMELCRRL